jgi:hypothetical protein
MIRRLLCAALAAAFVVLLYLYCLTPFAVYRFGIDLRPPWQDDAEWHLARIDWFVQDAGWEHIVLKHRAALIAMGPKAVSALIERAAGGNNAYDREHAIRFLKAIGDKARPLIAAAAADAEGDRRGRLLYAMFAAFNDRDAFDQWLDYALQRGPFALQDNHAEYDIQAFWDERTMPDYAVETGDGYAINPEFVTWWREHGSSVPCKIR